MKFKTEEGDLEGSFDHLVVAGWTGRDRSAVAHHIKELAELGVAPPSSVPLYYQCAPSLLTQKDSIDVLGPATSGEAEPLLVRLHGKTWLGLGSDHTDRALEAHSVAASKQICAKPVADKLWLLDSVASHLDKIRLQSWILEDGSWVRYQDGSLSAILPLQSLMSGAGLAEEGAMLCGTLPAIGGVRAAQDFSMALTDPVLDRTIAKSYSANVLEAVS